MTDATLPHDRDRTTDGLSLADAHQLRRLVDAVLTIGSDLALPAVLRRITETAAELVGARYAALGVLDDDRSGLIEFVTVGLTAHEVAGIGAPPKGHGILGLLIVDPQPIRLPDLKQHPDSFGFPPGHPPMASFLGVPILLRDAIYGNLYLTEKLAEDGSPALFTDADEALAIALANAAGLAIENARLHEQAQLAVLLEERERIARDLHDDVIQRLFATGLSVQASAGLLGDHAVATRLIRAVDDIDAAIRQVRSTIFELNQRPSGHKDIRAEIEAVCTEGARALGFQPVVRYDGPDDVVIPSVIHSHLALTLREALANIARHAHASAATVTVRIADAHLMLAVGDDGIGYRPEPGRPASGVANMAGRAGSLGGSFTIDGAAGRGTTVSWVVPLP